MSDTVFDGEQKYQFCTVNIIQRILDIAIVLAVSLPSLLVVLAVYLYFKLKIRDGHGFLYVGTRLGRWKKPFNILKIRTLRQGSETILAANLLQEGQGLELPYGKFLRKTRLDELPQLVNILKGDMSFVGPRPLRESVYLRNKPHIPNYDLRFLVRPGLTGYSQLFTPHSTPKRIRALVDNRFVLDPNRVIKGYALILVTVFAVIKNTFSEIAAAIRDRARARAGANGKANGRTNGQRFTNQRRLRRVSCRDVRIHITNGADHGSGQVLNMSAEAMLVNCRDLLKPGDSVQCVVKKPLASGRNGRRQHKIARCRATVAAWGGNGENGRYILFYEPKSELQKYIVQKYILRESVFH